MSTSPLSKNKSILRRPAPCLLASQIRHRYGFRALRIDGCGSALPNTSMPRAEMIPGEFADFDRNVAMRRARGSANHLDFMTGYNPAIHYRVAL